MAAFSDKTGGSVNGPKTESAHPIRKPKSLAADIKKLEDKYGAETLYQILGRAGDGAVRAGNDGLGQTQVDKDSSYPVRLYAPDPYDSAVDLKKAADPNVFGQKMMTDRDVEWLARKRDQMTAAEFKQFVASMYNKNDPAQLALLHEVYPQLLEEQKQIVNERFDLIKRLTMMSLTGKPESQQDLELLFALNTGAIQLPKGDMWDPRQADAAIKLLDSEKAMVEFLNGQYYMVDMGSTNGVEYNGQRIARKQIAEGDVFRICDHDLRFTYR